MPDKANEKQSLAKRIALPVAASAGSAATAYVARKAVPLLREQIERLADSGAANRGTDAIASVKDAVEEKVGSAVSAVSERLTDGEHGRSEAESRGAGVRQTPSAREFEKRRRERAEHRKARKRALAR
jgi:hypothetical protein